MEHLEKQLSLRKEREKILIDQLIVAEEQIRELKEVLRQYNPNHSLLLHNVKEQPIEEEQTEGELSMTIIVHINGNLCLHCKTLYSNIARRK
jgi:hypothetical protein